MNLMGMSYKGFVWRNNPTALNVTAARSVKETVLPFVGSRVEEICAQKRRVTGEGYFVGEDCRQQWNELKAVYESEGAGSLRLPGQMPFLAVMDSLKLIGVAGENLIKYSFSFIEAASALSADGSGVYRAEEGESLWDYARKTGREIDTLVKNNPDIADIARLRAGEEVRVP